MKSPRILVRPSGDSGPSRDGRSPRIPGETVEGKVISVEVDDVVIEVDSGGRAVIPVSDFSSLPTVGDQLAGLYLIDDLAVGAAILTKKTPEREPDRKKLRPGAFVVGQVVEAGKPGLRIRCGEISGFFPSSQLPPGLLKNPGVLLRKDVVGVVTEVRKGEMTLSLRTVLDRRKKQQSSKRITSFREGQRVSGKVVRKTDFGFFIDLGGIDGLLHVSRVKRHNEQLEGNGEEPIHFQAGQVVELLVSRVDQDRARIGLDLPDPAAPEVAIQPQPEEDAPADEVVGILRDLSAEGANVYVEDGVEGFVSAARFGDQSPRPGELRRFRIVSRDTVTGRLQLSLKLRPGPDDDDDDD